MPNFYLTKSAFVSIEEIYTTSVDRWGEDVAKKYIDDLYKSFQKIANDPELGNLRKIRSEPFLMCSAREHFVVYEKHKKDIIIVTILHQVRDIEAIIDNLGSSFIEEICKLKKSL